MNTISCFKKFGLFLILSLFLISCKKFIEPKAQGGLGGDVILNEKGVQQLLIGVYGVLDGVGGFGDSWGTTEDNWIYGSVAGGDAHKGSDAGDQRDITSIARFETIPSNRFTSSKWRALFDGVERANSVLRVLPKVEELSESKRKGIEGEARFLRGHFYFQLKMIFNNVPYVDESTTDFNQPNVGMDVWSKVEDDFQFAITNLPDIQADAGRVNSWAAKAYLAKTYVYQGKWDLAKKLYDDIIPNGVTSQGIKYDLSPKFNDIFNPALEDGAPFSVFAVRMISQDEANWNNNGNAGKSLNFPYNSPLGCCGFYNPTQELVNSFKTKDGLPLVDGSYNNLMVTNDVDVASRDEFEPYSGTLDPRLDWSVGRRGVPYHDWGPHPGILWTRGDPHTNGPYSPKKYVYWHKDFGVYADRTRATAIDSYIIRFAEVLLHAAEAEIEVGSLEKAREYVNRVRNRAANPEGFVSSKMNEAYAAGVVDNEADMLKSNVAAWNWVVRKDLGSTFMLLKEPASDINNWNEYKDPNYDIRPYIDPWTSKESARAFVHFEEKLEFALEGHRFFDLVRWGKAKETLDKYLQYEGGLFNDLKGAVFTDPKNRYYPVPQEQIDRSVINGTPVLKQNEGYN